MVASVYPVETPPLRDTERAESKVGEARCGAEGAFGLVKKSIHMGQPGSDCRDETFAIGSRHGRAGRWSDDGGRLATARKNSESDYADLREGLGKGGTRTRGCAFCQSRLE